MRTSQGIGCGHTQPKDSEAESCLQLQLVCCSLSPRVVPHVELPCHVECRPGCMHSQVSFLACKVLTLCALKQGTFQVLVCCAGMSFRLWLHVVPLPSLSLVLHSRLG
jgi:hypothetical protein